METAWKSTEGEGGAGKGETGALRGEVVRGRETETERDRQMVAGTGGRETEAERWKKKRCHWTWRKWLYRGRPQQCRRSKSIHDSGTWKLVSFGILWHNERFNEKRYFISFCRELDLLHLETFEILCFCKKFNLQIYLWYYFFKAFASLMVKI